MYRYNSGHMTKMAVMPICGESPSFFFSGIGGLISTKLRRMQHRGLEYYNLCINYDSHDLDYFTAVPALVAYAVNC